MDGGSGWWAVFSVVSLSLAACNARPLMPPATSGPGAASGGAPATALGGASGQLTGGGGAAGSGQAAVTTAQVVIGDDHSCELKADGSVHCWGSNSSGAATPPTDTFVQLAAGTSQTCGVHPDGSVACWGYGYDPARTLFTGPTDRDFTQVALGDTDGQGRHACGLHGNGQVSCWEDNDFGEGTPLPGPFVQIAAGHAHTCGLRPDGRVACWGRNDSGQASAPSGTFQQITCGDFHDCGVLTSGAVSCWGDDSQGQTHAPAGTFEKVSAWGDYTCGLKRDGTLTCWGLMPSIGSTPPSGTFIDVSAGGWEACARRSDGTVVCWNSNGVSTPPPPPPTGAQCGAFIVPNPVGTGLPHPSSYTDNGDGTITDNVTLLRWEKDPKPSVAQCAAIAQPHGGCTEAEAASYCAARGTGWRVPTRLELASLVDVTVPSTVLLLNPIFPPYPSNLLGWTSTLDGNIPGNVWFVRFDDGDIDSYPEQEVGMVRCVNGTPSCYTSRYQVQPGGLTVHDQATGLTWQRSVWTGDWSTVNAACNGMGNGWRLPNLLELQSLVDDDRYEPSIDETAFPDTPATFFWSSAVSPVQTSVGWAVHFGDGGTGFIARTGVYQARCVQ